MGKQRGRHLKVIGTLALLAACADFVARSLGIAFLVAGPEKAIQAVTALVATFGILLIVWGLSREIRSVRYRTARLKEEIEDACDTLGRDLKPKPPKKILKTA